METEIKKLPNSEVELKIIAPAEEFDIFWKKAVSELVKNIEIKGFRKGKVPKEIAIKHVGEQAILAEAAETAVSENYRKATRENKLEVLGEPKVEILKLARGNPFEFKAQAAIIPKINLPDYKKIASEMKKKEVSIEDDEIKKSLEWLRRSRAKFSQISSPAKKGDFVEIEFSESIENKSHKDAFVLGEGRFIPGFEEKLEGMESGKEKEFSLKMPDSYAKNGLAGKGADFKVKVISVQKMELPELNDEWAKNLGQFENLDALKKNIREGLLAEKENEERQKVRMEIIKKISEKSDFEIPGILVEKQKERMLDDLKAKISQNLKTSFEDYLAKIKKSEKEISDSLLTEAKKRVKNFLILREISKKENIEISSEEMEKEINKILSQYPAAKQKEIDLKLLRDYTEEELRNEKTFQLLENHLKK